MAGPIASAFVQIRARLNLENEGDIANEIRASIRRIESDLDSLEGAAKRTGRAIARQLGTVRIDLHVREALQDLERIDDAAEAVSLELHRLRGQDVGFDTQTATRNIRALDDRVKKLARTIQITDDEEIDFNVGRASSQLEGLEVNVENLHRELLRLSDTRPDLDISEAARDLDRLSEIIDQTLRNLNRVDQKQVRINIDDLEIDQLQNKVTRLDRETINIQVDTDGVRKAELELERVQNRAGDFSRAFRRIIAFGAIREAAQAVSQLFRAGVQAAGAIQTVQVTLNRFFAQTRDLGQTSNEFFGNLKKLAIETPFEFAGLADTSRRILAMGVDADEATDLMGSLADAIAAVGGGQGEIDGVVRALSQLSSKGRVDLQDFRQISENLPSLSRQMQIGGVIDELNRLHPGLNATVADFTALRNSGLITGKVLRDGIIGAIKEIPGVAGAARAASRTLQGALSNLADFAAVEFSASFAGLGRIISDELNAAFGSITTGDALTPLASAIREIVSSFGRAGESTLPHLIQGLVDNADEVSTFVQAISDLVEEALPAISNLSQGAFSSVTGLVALAETAFSLFNALPDSIQESVGGFITLAAVIPGAGETMVRGLKAVPALLNAIRLSSIATAASVNAVSKSTTAAAAAALAKANAARAAALSAIASAGAAAVLLVGIQIVTSTLATAKRRQDEFNDSIDEASRSFADFSTTTESAVDFVNKFRKAGEGVNIGGLEKFLDGLTSGEIEQKLGVTTKQLGGLVEEFARGGVTLDSEKGMRAALDRAGVSAEAFEAAGSDAIASTVALSAQFAEGAKVAFDSAVATQEYAFVTDEVAAALRAAAEASGDYVTANEELDAANDEGAKIELAKLKALGATEDQIDSAIAAHTKYTYGVDGAVKAEIDHVGALQRVREEMQKQDSIFEGLQDRYVGFTETFDNLANSVGGDGLGQAFTDFALAVNEAGLSTEEMNAIANELGNTLGHVLSGEELGKVVGVFASRVGEFKSSLESVVPSIKDLQFEADSFSLKEFLHQLEHIAEARTKVVANIDELITEFGTLGEEALFALTNSGLNPTQFAIAVDQALKGGEGKLKEIAERFAAVSGPELDTLARRLVASGFNETTVSEILGLDSFSQGVDDLNGITGELKAASAAYVAELEAFNRAIANAPTPGEARRLQDEQGKFRLSGGGSGATAAAPGIDVTAAVADATAAGEKIGKALATSTQTAAAAGFSTVSVDLSKTITGLSSAVAGPAVMSGLVIGAGLLTGFLTSVKNLTVSTKIAVAGLSLTLVGPALIAGTLGGTALGSSFDKTAKAQLDSAFENIQARVTVFHAKWSLLLKLAGEAGTRTFALALNSLSIVTLVELLKVDRVLKLGQAVLPIRGFQLGYKIGSEFGLGMDLFAIARAQTDAAGGALNTSGLERVGGALGSKTGFAIGLGMAFGISASTPFVTSATTLVVRKAIEAAEREAGIASPSRVFASIGHLSGEGFASGLLDTIPLVEDAAKAVANAAASSATGGPSIGQAGILSANPEVTQALSRLSLDSSGRGDGSQLGNDITFGPGSIVVNAAPGMTTEDAKELGAGIVDGIERRLTERQIAISGRIQ